MSYYEFQTTQRYVQCEDALLELKRYTYGLGKRFLIVTACGPITKLVTEKIEKSFSSSMKSMLQPRFKETNHKYAGYEQFAESKESQCLDIEYYFLDFETKPITYSTAKELADFIREYDIDVIIGIGGGKGMDFARAANHFVPEVKVVLVPTTASTNASVSQMCVIYNEEGSEIMDFWYMTNPQVLVLVDTNLLISAPAKNLVAGIGDCISTYYEAQNVLNMLGRREYYADFTWDAIEAAIQILKRRGRDAVDANSKHEVNQAYESVVAQILHNCGPIRAITGVGYAHVYDEALICFEECRKQLHGNLVGYATIAMKLFGKEPLSDIHEYIDFCRSIGIPVTFAEIGIEKVSREAMYQNCQKALEGTTVKAFPITVTAEALTHYAFLAEETVRAYLKLNQGQEAKKC